jgi:hypothetical protein
VSRVLNVAWYRFRATRRVRWRGYLSVIVLVGLLGGLSMGAIAAARRTQSSFSTFLASTNPSQLRIGTALYDPSLGATVGYNPSVISELRHLPHVRRVESAALINAVPYISSKQGIGPNGEPAPGLPTDLNTVGSVDGEYFNVDRVTITKGRMANPKDPYQVVLQASQDQALRPGQLITFGIYTNAQEAAPGFTTADKPYRRVVVKVVGVGASSDAVVADTVDDSGSFLVLFTPAFTKMFLKCCAKATPDTALQVDGGSRRVADVENEISKIWPKDFGTPDFYVTSVTATKAARALKPEAFALAMFGAIVGLAALVIAGQTIGRQLGRVNAELPILRSLGTSAAMMSGEAALGVGASIVLGTLLAIAVAIGLSPLAPLGVVRPVYPDHGIALDATVLTLGAAVLVVALGVFAGATIYRQMPRRAARRGDRGTQRSSGLVRRVAALGLPASAVVGIGFSIDRRAGRNAVPVRSAVLGVALAAIVAMATITFGASLNHLVSRPALYGWNWNYEIIAGGGSGDIPGAQTARLLDDDHDVTAWSGVYFSSLYLDGVLVPVLGAQPGASVAPPILSGHGFDATNQVVLGALTLAQLHKRVGDTIYARGASSVSTPLRIVGTAVMPAIGTNYSQHLEMGTGALLSSTLIPAFERNTFNSPAPGPNAIFVRTRPGVGGNSLQRIANETSTTADDGVSVDGVQRPAEIINYRSLGTAPAWLAAALVIGAVIAFALTLISAVQRRRRELALLKTLGFTRRQLAAVVAWQASTDVTLGAIVGLAVGVVVGRWLWELFARNIDVVPAPIVPLASIAIIFVGALILANLIAAVPGLLASRMNAASVLRSE